MTEEEKKKQDEQQEAAVQPAVETQTPPTNPYPRPTADFMPEQTGFEAREKNLREWRDRLYAQNDPVKQAEDDKRRRIGRTFWTGATIAANTIANAINVNGTGNYAPSMQWDTGQQKMIDDWRQQDADIAKQRQDALDRMQKIDMMRAEMEDAGTKAKNDAAQNNFNLNYALDKDDYLYGRGKADKEAAAKQAHENAKELAKINNDAAQKRANTAAAAKKGTTGGGARNGSGGSFSVGNMVFSGMPKGADSVIINQLFNLMKKAKRVTTNEDGTQKVEPWLSLREMNQTKLADITNVVNQHFDDIWNSDPEFNKNLVRMLQNYGRYQSGWMCRIGDTTVYESPAADEQSNGGQQNNKSNNSNNNNSGGKKSYHL